MFYLHYFIDTIGMIQRKNQNRNNKKNVLLLGDGFFARGFLSCINKNKFNITQIYRDDFINPQDIFYSLHHNKPYNNAFHIKDKLIYNNIIRIKENITTLEINNTNSIINNKMYLYDYCVIGLGGQKSLKEWSTELTDLTDLTDVNNYNNKEIDIIGMGPVGFEIAMLLNNNKVNLYDALTRDKVMSYVNIRQKEFLLKLLERKNITVNVGQFYNANNSNYKIFCVGTKPNNLTKDIKSNDKCNAIINDVVYNNIYIGGDCVFNNMIKNAQYAYNSGVYVAKRLNNNNNNNNAFEYKSNGISLNINKKVLISNHNIMPDGIYPDFIIKLYSIFCI
jgi:NADH dehydrogenase FAD-containing subunit